VSRSYALATAAVLRSYRDHHGDQLTGCVACNVWRGDKGAFIVELAVEDWEAMGKLRESVRWTLRPKKPQH
jgi:hypothetical protein